MHLKSTFKSIGLLVTAGLIIALNACENPTTVPKVESKLSSAVLNSSSSSSGLSSSPDIGISSGGGNSSATSSTGNNTSSQTANSSSNLPTSSTTALSSTTNLSSSATTPSKTMTINITTTAFSPCASGTRNDVAVYVMTSGSSPAFIKTLSLYGGQAKYLQYLAQWKTEASAAFTASSTQSTIQAIDGWSGATRASMTTPPINISWNLKNKSGTLIADGDYTLKLVGACENINNQYTATASFNIKNGLLTTSPLSKSTNFNITSWTLQ